MITDNTFVIRKVMGAILRPRILNRRILDNGEGLQWQYQMRGSSGVATEVARLAAPTISSGGKPAIYAHILLVVMTASAQIVTACESLPPPICDPQPPHGVKNSTPFAHTCVSSIR